MVRALEDRPITVDTVAEQLGEVLNLVAPRLSEALFHRFDRAFGDSRAAARAASGSGQHGNGSGDACHHDEHAKQRRR